MTVSAVVEPGGHLFFNMTVILDLLSRGALARLIFIRYLPPQKVSTVTYAALKSVAPPDLLLEVNLEVKPIGFYIFIYICVILTEVLKALCNALCRRLNMYVNY